MFHGAYKLNVPNWNKIIFDKCCISPTISDMLSNHLRIKNILVDQKLCNGNLHPLMSAYKNFCLVGPSLICKALNESLRMTKRHISESYQ